MKIYEKLTKGLESYKEELLINDSVELFFNSPSNTYVVYDGTAKVYFEGTFSECYAYCDISSYDFLKIWSKEMYNKYRDLCK